MSFLFRCLIVFKIRSEGDYKDDVQKNKNQKFPAHEDKIVVFRVKHLFPERHIGIKQ